MAAEVIPACAGEVETPAFEDGQTVCFLGDSITQGALYQLVIEYFYAIRYPHRCIVFWNAGIAGDTAQSIQTFREFRLEEDVLRHKPDVVAVMLGMNDVNRGLYEPGRDPEMVAGGRVRALEAYRDNMEQLLKALAGANAGIILLTPTIYEEGEQVPGDPRVLKGVNDGLGEMARWLRNEAEAPQVGLVDFHARLGEINARIQGVDPEFSVLRLGRASGLDRVHPYMPCHWIMAAIFLKAQGHSSLVSRVEVDAQRSQVVLAERAVVGNVRASKDHVSFEVLHESLPFVVAENGKAALEVYPLTNELSREILCVRGLAAGQYELRIDQSVLGRYSHVQLEKGIDLGALSSGPRWAQSITVYELARERYRLVGRLRNLAARRYEMAKQGGDARDDVAVAAFLRERAEEYHRRNADPAQYNQSLADLPIQDELEAEASALSRRMREAAQPIQRHYELVRVRAPQ